MWLDLCEMQLHSPVFGLITDDYTSISYLENMGFLVSTETPQLLIVKMLGYQSDHDGSFFCGGHCE